MLYVYDATAGISTLNVVKSDDENVYNLQGARMPKSVQLAPGIYIRGGKKFVVRQSVGFNTPFYAYIKREKGVFSI